MFEQFNTLRSLFNQAKPELVNYLPTAEITTLEQEIDQRTASHQPIVMVYGVYNAGKSTLINALLGKEVAEVGDIPKTDKVDSYQLGDVQILDTPGIDAPIEHEQITREQLSKSDAVIFVLNSDGVLEEKQTYVEIGEILAANKPILVVINNKSGYKTNDPDYITLVEKFRTNLYQHFAGDEEQLERLKDVHEYLVNAQLALKGKLDDRPKLVEISQIAPLEAAVTRLFKATNSAQVAKTLASQVQLLVQKAINLAKQNADQYELQRLEELISNAASSQVNLLDKVLAHANKSKPALKSEMAALLENKQTDAANNAMQHWQQQQTNFFEHQVERELKRLDTEAAEVAKLFINLPSNPLQANQSTGELEGIGLTDLLSTLAGRGINLGLTDGFAKQGIVEILKQGKSWLPSLFKGVGQKTMEKMAGKVVPFISPAIDVVTAIYDYQKAAEQEQRQISQQRQQLESINHKINLIVEELYQSLTDGLEDALKDTFDPIVRQLKHSLAQLSKQAGGVEININALKETYHQLAKL